MENMDKSETHNFTKMNKIDSTIIDRIIPGLMQQYQCDLDRATDIHKSLKLQLRAGQAICKSIALQSAFLTALNTGLRSFVGGLNYELPQDVPNLLPNRGFDTFNQLVRNDFVDLIGFTEVASFTLLFGIKAKNENELEIVCNGWQAGVLVCNDNSIELDQETDFALGGVAAGSLGVALAFMKVTQIAPYCTDFSSGISLWNTNCNWLSNEAKGPKSVSLPKDFWLMGLGHLGQAYLWVLSLMPFEITKEVNFKLQDFDLLEQSNIGTGLLSSRNDIGKLKIEVCKDWLMERGFSVFIIEEKLSDDLKFIDPKSIALCGFDNAFSRSLIEKFHSPFIVESALGSSKLDFDKIVLHTFPNEQFQALNLWLPHVNDQEELDDFILDRLKDHQDKCGVQTLAGKAISTSFVGAFAGSLAISELVKWHIGAPINIVLSKQIRRLQKISSL